MSHQITSKDSCFTLEPTWHGLETITKAINYETSGLNWKVEKEKIKTVTEQEIDGFQAVVCKEKDVVINVSKDSYALIQNEQLFEVIDESLKGIDYNIISAGSLGGLKRVYISVELTDNQEYLVNGDKFKNYLSFVSSHDGSLAFEAYDTSLRIVCSNTLQWSRKSKGVLNLRVRHTKNSQLKIENMKEEIEKLFEKREEFYSTYEGLCSRPMDSKTAENIINGFLSKGEPMSTRAQNQANEIFHLFKRGMGNNGETVADLLNGVTEYYSRKSTDNKVKQFSSSEFGNGKNKKLDFWQAITDDELDTLAAKGEKLLLQNA